MYFTMIMLLAKLLRCAQAAFGSELAIFEFTSASISKPVSVRSLCYVCQFSFILLVELITVTTISHWLALKKRLRGTQKGCIESAFAFARAGYLKYSIALGTVGYLEKETRYVPWRTALNSLGFLGGILGDRRGNGYFQVCIQFYVIVPERSRRQ